MTGRQSAKVPFSSYSLDKEKIRRLIYPALVIVIYVLWLGYMFFADIRQLFQGYWPVSVTMAMGSFVAGSTPGGGSAFAFPIFTKVLHIPAGEARTFGLMIQAIGMTMAGVLIVTRRIRFLPHVVTWASLGGALGIIMGTFYLIIPNPYPKVLFTFVMTTFGVALAISRWGVQFSPRDDLPVWGNRQRLSFALVGFAGGAFASSTGSGIDMLIFVVLTLAFGINEKISTPTTVIIMGLNSVVGFCLRGVVLDDIGRAWHYWLVSVPIVILGAPLGSYVVSRVKRDYIIVFLLFLIALELVTTLWLVPFTRPLLLITLLAVTTCATWFWAMLRYRHKRASSSLKYHGSGDWVLGE